MRNYLLCAEQNISNDFDHQNGWCWRPAIREKEVDSLLWECDIDHVPCRSEWIWPSSCRISKWGMPFLPSGYFYFYHWVFWERSFSLVTEWAKLKVKPVQLFGNCLERIKRTNTAIYGVATYSCIWLTTKGYLQLETPYTYQSLNMVVPLKAELAYPKFQTVHSFSNWVRCQKLCKNAVFMYRTWVALVYSLQKQVLEIVVILFFCHCLARLGNKSQMKHDCLST